MRRTPEAPSDSPSVDRRILSYTRQARTNLYLAIAAGFMASALVVGQAWLLSGVVSRVFIEHQRLSDVTPLMFLILGLALGRAVLACASDVLAQRSSSHLKSRLRDDLTRRLALLGPTYVLRERSGELLNSTVRGVEDLDEYIVLYQPLRFLAALVPPFVAVVVFVIDPFTLLILVVTGPVLVLLLALIGGRAKELTQRRFVELSWMSAFLLDLLQGLPTLKMFGRSREQVENVREVSRRYGNTTMDVLRTAFETSFVLELGAAIAIALVAVEVSLRLIHGGLPFDRALAVLLITPEFFLPLRQLSTRYHAASTGRAAAERLFAILDTPLPQTDRPPKHASPIRPPAEISFDGVSFSYEDGDRPALHGVSFTIPRGGKVALVGETGAGKTTVANLLLRFIEPSSGCITVGGVPLGSIDPTTWRKSIAWVPQHPRLFHGTIFENIRLARPEASFDETIAAASDAGAHEFIWSLRQGYDTVVGENGARLSGGQQQRVAIARAFLKDAPFLILDEATSHLDAASEARILEALQRLLKNRMAMIIAHNPSLSRIADRVVVIDQGRVAELTTRQPVASAGRNGRLLSYDAGAP